MGGNFCTVLNVFPGMDVSFFAVFSVFPSLCCPVKTDCSGDLNVLVTLGTVVFNPSLFSTTGELLNKLLKIQDIIYIYHFYETESVTTHQWIYSRKKLFKNIQWKNLHTHQTYNKLEDVSLMT